MYFSCQITKRELDPGATDASEVHDSLNENCVSSYVALYVSWYV